MTQGSILPLILSLNSPLMNSVVDTTKDEGRDYQPPMARKFQIAAQLESDEIHPPAPPEPAPWKPVHYFFYGSLMDGQQLAGVLRLDFQPVLRPASIVGYSIKMWGPYPALIDGPAGNVVNGVVYEVQEEVHEKWLAYYETDAYRCTRCGIKLGAGGEVITGKTFVWADDADDEDLSVGSFDLGAWKRARAGSP